MIAPIEINMPSLEEIRKDIEDQSKIFKALGHPTRLYIARYLMQGEKCVCDLQALVGDDISTISRHLTILSEAKIVQSRKDGVYKYYSLELSCLGNFLECLANQ